MNVIKIGAVWCPGCLVMKPRWVEIEKIYPDLYTEYYDFDENYEDIAKFNVEGTKLPVYIFVDKKGLEITRMHGEVSKQSLLDFIDKHKLD